MTIRIPDSLRDTEINIGVEIPQPEIRMEKNKDGSMSLSAHYDMCDISEFAWCVAKELNDDIEKAFIEDLLELNGYIKERTCKAVFNGTHRGYNPRLYCSECGTELVGKYCYECGAKVVK